jgi:hypothetical protein
MSWNEAELKPDTPYQPWDDAADVSAEAIGRYNVEQKALFEAELALEDKFAGKSAEQIQKEYEQKLAEQERATIPQRQIQAVHQFIVETPELVLNPKNQSRIDAYLKVAKLDATDPEHFTTAYRALASRNLLDIDESKRPRTPRARYSQDDLYEMPMAELERLARRNG